MLAGCSSTLLSPRHNRQSTTLQASCHFQLPTSMNTHKLDLPPCCSFPSTSRPPPSLSIPGRPLEAASVVSTRTPTPTTTGSSCSLKQSMRLPISPATAAAGQKEIGGSHQFWEEELLLLEEEQRQQQQEERRKRGGRFWVSSGTTSSTTTGRKKKRGACGDGDDVERFLVGVEEEKEGWTVAKRKKVVESGGGEDGGLSLWFQDRGAEEEGEEEVYHPFSITCSEGGVLGQQMNLCFVPGRSHNHPWVGMGMVNHPDQLSEDDDDEKEKEKETDQQKQEEETDPQNKSQAWSSGGGELIGYGRSSHGGYGNGSSTATRPPSSSSHNGNRNIQQEAEEEKDCRSSGFELVTLLTSCVESITTRNIPAVNHYIARLGDTASPTSPCPLTRLIAYFTEALILRITRAWPQLFHLSNTTTGTALPPPLPPQQQQDDETIHRLLNQITPIPKFIHFTANEMILRAFEGKDKVHIIDFDIKQGLQWPALFQRLATRRNPPRHVRITGIGESKQELVETGERLTGFAQAFNLPFKFHPVVDRLEDVRLWMLHVKGRGGDEESVAVNCVQQLHRVLYDESGGAFRDLMGIIRSTNPTVVVVAEQEAEHNELGLERRVCNSLRYYAAVFDGLDVGGAGFPAVVRGKVEEMFGREIRNIIGCEGRDRVERHVGFRKWCGMMREQEWLRCVGVSEMELMQSKMLLKLHQGMEEYQVMVLKEGEEDEEQGLSLRWMDQPLYTVSAWGRVEEEEAPGGGGS